ncbi:MAG: SLATT domain-containing protein [Acidobacteriota bacterium]
MNEQAMTIDDAALPQMFRICDEVARKAQAGHIRLVKIHIGLGLALVAASQMLYTLSGALAKPPLSWRLPIKMWLLPLGLGTFITLGSRLLLRGRQWEQTWCRSRAAAEQIRSRAWLYMMGLEGPLEQDGDAARTREEFTAEVETVRREWEAAVPLGRRTGAELPEVTPQMDAVRALPFAEKLQVYLASRVRQQADWFEQRARQFDKKQKLFTSLTEFFEVGAALFALLLVLDVYDIVRMPAGLPLAWTVFLSPCLAAAAVTLAWMGYKRYSELHSSYRANAEKLLTLTQSFLELASGPPDWTRLAPLVRNCEDLLTWENRIWFVRRVI